MQAGEGALRGALVAQPLGLQPPLVQLGEVLAGVPLLGAAAPFDQSHADAVGQAGEPVRRVGDRSRVLRRSSSWRVRCP